MTRLGLRLAVFDCDGTLVDSQATIVGCMAAAFAADGRAAPTGDAVRHRIGLPLVEVIAALAPEAGSEGHARLTALYRQAFSAQNARGEVAEPLFPGIVAALDRLEAAGFVLGVATGKGRRGLTMTLERHGLLGRFLTLQTADVAAGKPHPEMLERAMAETGATPRETVMIGDTSYDMQMARNAGTAALGVAWGYHPPEALRAAGADHVVDDAAEIDAALHRLRGA
jgi:phosphoglycolate phosphatase